jgi:hypothetical protein
MTTWIAHLRIAENLLNDIDGLDPSYFAIGNVAPDSGIWNEATQCFEPPVETTHFLISHEDQWPYADLKFYREYLKEEAKVTPDDERLALMWGYFFHLVADNLWDHHIGRLTKDRFSAEFESDPDFIWEVKRDWYGLDLHYVRHHPDAFYWRVFLKCEYRQDYLDFLTPEAINQRLEYINSLYQRTDEEIETKYGNRPDKYLSEEDMNTFIDETTNHLIGIYEHLKLDKSGSRSNFSALELMQDLGEL